MATRNSWPPEIHGYRNLTRSFMLTQHLFNKFIMYRWIKKKKACC
jgi:hypothetical protein